VILLSNCNECGFPLKYYGDYCPNCGASIKKKEISLPSFVNVWRILQAGLLGAFLSTTILYFFPGVNLYFIPSFISSLAVIYLFRPRGLYESIAISLAVYLLADGIWGGMFLGTYHLQNISLADVYGNYVPTLADVIFYVSNPITAVIGGYIGSRFISKPKYKMTPPYGNKRRQERGGIVYNLKNLPENIIYS
jgi:hypothetical protein